MDDSDSVDLLGIYTPEGQLSAPEREGEEHTCTASPRLQRDGEDLQWKKNNKRQGTNPSQIQPYRSKMEVKKASDVTLRMNKEKEGDNSQRGNPSTATRRGSFGGGKDTDRLEWLGNRGSGMTGSHGRRQNNRRCASTGDHGYKTSTGNGSRSR